MRGEELRRDYVSEVSSVVPIMLLIIAASTTNGIAAASIQEASSGSVIHDPSLLSTKVAGNDNPRIAVVKPIFTDTAYSNAFYTFYRKHRLSTEPYITSDLNYFNVTVKDGWRWSKRLFYFLTSVKASLAGLSLHQNVALIDEINVTLGALFDEDSRVYDVVILGFTEYVTVEEYNYYRRFVETGGTLIILDACNFLAEVKYHPPTSPGEPGYLSLVKGHGWEFNGTHAWKSVYRRWPEENRNWVGSNYWKYWYGDHYDYFQANTSHPISAYIRDRYMQNVTTSYGAHEENKLENFTDTQIIGYWHFIDKSEAPEDPVVAYQHRYGSGSVFHAGIMGSDVIGREEYLQAFLVSAVRMGLTGEVGDWSFWQDSFFDSHTELLYENGTKVGQDGYLSGVVMCNVSLNTTVIAQDGGLYELTSVDVHIYPTDSSVYAQMLTVAGKAMDEDNLHWQVVVDTPYLLDGKYTFEVRCRFTSRSNDTLHVDSILMISVHEVKNIPDKLRDALLVASTSLCAIMVLACVAVIWTGRRPT
jgi:hypothetical protein